MLRDRHGAANEAPAWEPPVVPIAAGTGKGVDQLSESIGLHLAWLDQTHHFEAHRLAMQRVQLSQRIWRELRQRLMERRVGDTDQLSHWAGRILAAEATLEDALVAILGGEAKRPAMQSSRRDVHSRPDNRQRRKLES